MDFNLRRYGMETDAVESASASKFTGTSKSCWTGASIVTYEIYMKNSLLSFVVENLETLVEANDGSPNPSGYVGGGPVYNYDFVHDLHRFMAGAVVTVTNDEYIRE